jgi:glucosamine kinase
MARYFAGIDGGGTKCRLRLRAADGRLIGEAMTGRANIYASVEEAFDNIMAGVHQVLNKAQLPVDTIRHISAGLGLAGGALPERVAALKARLPFETIRIETDGYAALSGAFLESDGAIAILGTGTAYLGRKADETISVGGWGFNVGDQGSGADLGRNLLRETLHAFDGMIAKTDLTRETLNHFGGDPNAILEFARTAMAIDYGQFAPKVFAAAQTGDAVALALVKAGADAIGSAVSVLEKRGISRLCPVGGLAEPYQPFLGPVLRMTLTRPDADAMEGALRFAPNAPWNRSAPQ